MDPLSILVMALSFAATESAKGFVAEGAKEARRRPMPAPPPSPSITSGSELASTYTPAVAQSRAIRILPGLGRPKGAPDESSHSPRSTVLILPSAAVPACDWGLLWGANDGL
jgi:hypothetical protein